MFRIAVNAPCEEVISLLNKKILMQKETFRRYKISNYIAEIYQNEDYDRFQRYNLKFCIF